MNVMRKSTPNASEILLCTSMRPLSSRKTAPIITPPARRPGSSGHGSPRELAGGAGGTLGQALDVPRYDESPR